MCYIVTKGNEYYQGCWIHSIKPLYRWSIYASDAKQYADRAKAKRMAQKIGGEVAKYDPLTGEVKKQRHECDNCVWYVGWSGECRCKSSPFYMGYVSMHDTCKKWEGKK